MRFILFTLLTLGLIAGSGAGGYYYYFAPKPMNEQFRTQIVRRCDITRVVNSTGTVQPVLSVQVGAFVSGPVQNVLVDFNAKVKKDQLLAQVDPRNYKSAVLHAEAGLAHAKADLDRVTALLEQSRRTEQRNTQLIKTHAISPFEFDQSVTDRKSLEAQVKLAEAIIRQSDADLGTANTNLEFCDIKSPVDGIVIDRKVDPGQVVAAQFQTPVMFVVAPDLEKLVYVNASVDEADIGLIRDAQRTKQPVTFTVDAYPKDTFQGQIAQVRLNSTTVSNVVTYTVIVEAPNGELKLLPGMTANLAFQIEKKANLLTVPNAALRFHPTVEQVRLRDRAIVDGSEAQELEDKVAEQKAAEQKAPEQKSVEKNVTEQKTPELNNHGSTSGFAKTSASRDTVTKGSATKDSTSKAIAIRPVPSKDTASKAAVTTPKLDDKKHPDAKDEAAQRGKKAYVWVIEGNELAAIEVVAGVSDKRRTEIISGDLTEGRELVTGIKLKTVKPQEAGGP